MKLLRHKPAQTRPKLIAMCLVVAASCVAVFGCSSPEFYVNPTFAPTSAASPEPSSTAQVFRIATVENPPTPTPTPRPFPAGAVLANPRILILNAVENKMRNRDHAVVSARFIRALPPEDASEVASGTSPENWPEIMVTVEGEYAVEVEPHPDPRRGNFSSVDFHLTFHHEPVSAENGHGPEPWDTEIEVRRSRYFKDTTRNNIPNYSTHAQFMDTIPTSRDPTMSTFLGLALTEDLILEDEMYRLMMFDSFRMITPLGEDGSELWVVGATRTQPNGDVEEWTFWIDEDEIPRKIGLRIENATDPTRRIQDVELEISELGDCLPNGGLCR